MLLLVLTNSRRGYGRKPRKDFFVRLRPAKRTVREGWKGLHLVAEGIHLITTIIATFHAIRSVLYWIQHLHYSHQEECLPRTNDSAASAVDVVHISLQGFMLPVQRVSRM